MKQPPLVLVKTWYNLLINQENKEASAHAQNMLLGALVVNKLLLIILESTRLSINLFIQKTTEEYLFFSHFSVVAA